MLYSVSKHINCFKDEYISFNSTLKALKTSITNYVHFPEYVLTNFILMCTIYTNKVIR